MLKSTIKRCPHKLEQTIYNMLQTTDNTQEAEGQIKIWKKKNI